MTLQPYYKRGQAERQKQQRHRFIKCHIKVINLPKIVINLSDKHRNKLSFFKIEAQILNNNNMNACMRQIILQIDFSK